jgi:hypothetical protein
METRFPLITIGINGLDMDIQTELFEQSDEAIPAIVDPHMGDPKRDASRRGRWVEFKVCMELTAAGFYVIHDDAPGYDLTVTVNGRPFRVQVKSSSMFHRASYCWGLAGSRSNREAMRGGSRGNRGPLTPNHADLLCLYHFASDAFMFKRIEGPMDSIALPVSQFINTSWLHSLRIACAN